MHHGVLFPFFFFEDINTMPLVQLCVDGSGLLYEVSGFEDLKRRAGVHFPWLAGNDALALSYTDPNDASNVLVSNERDFAKALVVWDQQIRHLQLQRREPILPTFSVVRSPPAGSSVLPTGGKKRAPPSETPGERLKSAPPPAGSDAPPSLSESDSSQTPNMKTVENSAALPATSIIATSTVSTDWYHSHEVAQSLLANFKKFDPIEPPSIRATLRGGQASCRVPFDPFYRPDVGELKLRVQSALMRVLPPAEQDRLHAAVGDGSVKFLLYASTPSAPVDLDVDDNTDIAVICDEIKRINRDRDVYDDFSVQLIAEWVSCDELPEVCDDPRLFSGDDARLPTQSMLLEEVLLPPRSALSVNLAHTPKRERHVPIAFEPDDEEPPQQ